MRVAFVIHEMTGGGAERVISVLANYMVKKSIDVSILMTAGAKVEYELEPEVRVIQVGVKTSGNPLNFVRRILRLRSNLKEGAYDAVVAFEADTGLYTTIASTALGKGILISERNDPDKYKHKLLRWFTYTHAEKIIFQTEDARNYFDGEIKKKGVVIANPINDALPIPYEGDRNKSIVSVGRLELQKNYKVLIEAFEMYHKDHPDYSLHIYGEGGLREELQSRIDVGKAKNNIVLEGFCDNVIELIRNASMFVMTSDYEGMPNALMEAMAIGLPVISTDCPIGGPRELIEDGVNGLLVNVGDAKGTAKAMSKIADDIEFASKIGEEAKKIREKYNTETICMKWIEALKL